MGSMSLLIHNFIFATVENEFNGKGYALLKFSDYFCILIIPIMASNLFFFIANCAPWRKGISIMVLIALVAFFIFISIIEKGKILDFYEDAIVHRHFTVSQLTAELKKLNRDSVYWLDVNQDYADLILYANRMNRAEISSLRFSYRYRWRNWPNWPDLSKIGGILRGTTIEIDDINQAPGFLSAKEGRKILEVIKYQNHILIGDYLENNGWLGRSEGELGNRMRWLNKRAPFVIFPDDDLNESRFLHLTLSRGPDLVQENSIVIFVEDEAVFSISKEDLGAEKEITIALGKSTNARITKAKIEVLGPQIGLRQLRAKNMFIRVADLVN